MAAVYLVHLREGMVLSAFGNYILKLRTRDFPLKKRLNDEVNTYRLEFFFKETVVLLHDDL